MQKLDALEFYSGDIKLGRPKLEQEVQLKSSLFFVRSHVHGIIACWNKHIK